MKAYTANGQTYLVDDDGNATLAQEAGGGGISSPTSSLSSTPAPSGFNNLGSGSTNYPQAKVANLDSQTNMNNTSAQNSSASQGESMGSGIAGMVGQGFGDVQDVVNMVNSVRADRRANDDQNHKHDFDLLNMAMAGQQMQNANRQQNMAGLGYLSTQSQAAQALARQRSFRNQLLQPGQNS